jgi:glycerophosphoryl diester phosphodiesterase
MIALITRILCHRGYSSQFPENTMLAFIKALETGADGVELDVHFTKDKQLVVIHDETLDRTTNGIGAVSDHTLRELQQVDASYKWRGQIPPQRIPTLEEYLSLVKDREILTNIELKTNVNPYPGIEQAVWDMVQDFHLENNVIFSSFSLFSCIRMRRLSGRPCGYLTDEWDPQGPAFAHAHGLQAYHPHYLSVTRSIMQQAVELGLEVNTYTPNRKIDLRRLMSLGVSSVITNCPERALALRAKFRCKSF